MRVDGVTAWLVALLGTAQGGDDPGDELPALGGGQDPALQVSPDSVLIKKAEVSEPDYLLEHVQLTDPYYLDYPGLLQPVKDDPPELDEIELERLGRDGCPAQQPFGPCELPKAIGSCGYGQECCCGKCHPKFMVHCNSDGWWGRPFFYDACLQACPTQPTTSTTPSTTTLLDIADIAELADVELTFAELVPQTTEDPEQREQRERESYDGCPATSVLPQYTGGPCPSTTISRCEYGEECCCGECHSEWFVNCNDDGFWGGFYKNDACVGVSCPTQPSTSTLPPSPDLTDPGIACLNVGFQAGASSGWPWGGSTSNQDCGTLEQRIMELEREKTRLDAQRRSCSSSSSSAEPSQQPDLVWSRGRTSDNVKG